MTHDIFYSRQAPKLRHFSVARNRLNHDSFYSRQAPKLRHFLSPENAWTMTVFIVVKHLNYVIFCCQKSPEPWQFL